MSAVCFEAEDNIKKYERKIELPREINVERSEFTWESDGKVHIQLRKKDLPSYWQSLVKLPEGTDLIENKVAMWKAMHIKYSESVELYRQN